MASWIFGSANTKKHTIPITITPVITPYLINVRRIARLISLVNSASCPSFGTAPSMTLVLCPSFGTVLSMTLVLCPSFGTAAPTILTFCPSFGTLPSVLSVVRPPSCSTCSSNSISSLSNKYSLIASCFSMSWRTCLRCSSGNSPALYFCNNSL